MARRKRKRSDIQRSDSSQSTGTNAIERRSKDEAQNTTQGTSSLPKSKRRAPSEESGPSHRRSPTPPSVDHDERARRIHGQTQTAASKRDALRSKNIRLISEYKRQYPKYQTDKIVVKVRLTPPKDTSTPDEWLRFFSNAIRDLEKHYFDDLKPSDKVRLELHSENLYTCIATSIMDRADFSAEGFLARISAVLQSNESIFVDAETLQFYIDKIHMDRAGVRVDSAEFKGMLGYEEESIKRRSCVKVTVPDNLCLPAAIALGIRHQRKGQTKDNMILYDSMRRRQNTILKAAAEELYRKVHGEDPTGQPCPLVPHLELYQRHFKDQFMIIVWSYPAIDGKPYFIGESSASHQLLLFKSKEHIDLVSSPARLMGKGYYCPICVECFKRKKTHKCPVNCSYCGRPKTICHPNPTEKKQVYCDDCCNGFYSQDCYEAHKETLCKKVRRCPDCYRKLKPSGAHPNHGCGEVMCNGCRRMVNPREHLCYVPKPRPKQNDNEAVCVDDAGESENDDTGSLCSEELEAMDEQIENDLMEEDKHNYEHHKILAYDFETYETPEADHMVHLAIAQTNFDCGDLCSKEKPVIFNYTNHKEKVLEAFCRWTFDLLKNAEPESTITAVAHYASKFDAIFIYEWFLSNTKQKYDELFNGAKLIHLQFKLKKSVLRFIDSYASLTQPLHSLPAMYDLEEQKGFFPHKFSREQFLNYEGELPERKYYAAEEMSEGRKKEFEEWYDSEKKKGVRFNYQEELIKYCIDDVLVLYAVIMKFRETFFHECKMDPLFPPCLTIASATHLLFRKYHMKSKSIGLIPSSGCYSAMMNHSKVSLEWLLYMEDKEKRKYPDQNVYIQHAGTHDEFVVEIPTKHEGQTYNRRLHVDGLLRNGKGKKIKPNGRPRVYEFLGCLFHGCRLHNTWVNFNNLRKKTFGELYDETFKRFDDLEKHGYEVKFMWECEWNKKKKSNKKIAAFLMTLDLAPPLNCRDAYFGGRTEAIRLFHSVIEALGERIEDIDFCSLYPSVMFKKYFPLGHPIQKLVNLTIKDLMQCFGFVKCTVVPPRFVLLLHIAHTTLVKPSETYTTRYFLCGEFKQVTYTSFEIQLAVEHGYRVKKIHEIWDYPKKSNTLFTSFIGGCMRGKTEAKGYKGFTDAMKDKFIQDFFDHEGIELRKEKMTEEKNVGLYSLGKLLANSSYGKWGQKLNRNISKTVSTPEEYFKIIAGKENEVSRVGFFGDNAHIVYTVAEDAKALSANTSVALAAMITSYGRLELWKELNKLAPDAALYCDTDSIIYVKRPNQYTPPTGSYLGQLTNQLKPKEGNYIKEFFSAGAKNYGYSTDLGHQVLKIRGFTLRPISKTTLNYDIVKDLVQKLNISEKIEVNMGSTLVRDPKTFTIKTTDNIKHYRMCFMKRVIYRDVYRLPFGYNIEMTNDFQ